MLAQEPELDDQQPQDTGQGNSADDPPSDTIAQTHLIRLLIPRMSALVWFCCLLIGIICFADVFHQRTKLTYKIFRT